MSNFFHLTLDNQVYFITTTIQSRRKVFASDENASLMLRVLEEIQRNGSAKIYAFVIMPDHLHLILKPETESLSKIMQKIKGKSSRLINQRKKGTGQIWQKEYYERAVRDERDLNGKYQYIIYNPVKMGLVQVPEHYPYSSAALPDMTDSP